MAAKLYLARVLIVEHRSVTSDKHEHYIQEPTTIIIVILMIKNIDILFNANLYTPHNILLMH